jgi:hypothetical protein
MSVNTWVGLVIIVVPIGMLLVVFTATRIWLLLCGDRDAAQGRGASRGNPMHHRGSASPHASPPSLVRR